VKQLAAEGQQAGTPTVGEKAEVANAHEAARKQMQEEPAQELVNRQRHQLLLVAMGGVAPAESDVAVFEGNKSAVGDSHAMGVCAEIAQGMLGTTEGALGVDDPVVTEQGSQPSREDARLGKVQECSVEVKIAGMKGGLQSSDELAAKDAAEYLDGQKEAAG
jgi:hypothetical protein